MAARKFSDPGEWPAGFQYRAEFLSAAEETDLLSAIEKLEFGTYDFRGYIAKRRVVAYGGGYEHGTRRMAITENGIPEFLSAVRKRAAAVAALHEEEIAQAMVTEYSVGTPIGWHRDAPQFGTITGISLRSASRLRLKPYKGEGKIVAVELEPRSIYVLSGAARSEFMHSIPAVKELRYSITFRTLRSRSMRQAA